MIGFEDEDKGGKQLALQISARPELKTASGEVTDLYVQKKYVGTMTLVYRDSDRLHGAIQLDEEQVNQQAQEDIISFAQSYVQALVNAMNIELCEILVTYGGFAYILDEDWLVNDDSSLLQTEEMIRQQEIAYELEWVDKNRHRLKFQINQTNGEHVADATMKFNENKLVSTLNFRVKPSEEEIEQIAMLITDFFHEEKIDVFRFKIKVNGKHMHTMKFSESQFHFMYKDKSNNVANSTLKSKERFTKDQYSIQLIRDDEETLTYEIYQDAYKKTLICTATIDIGKEQLTGYIDFKSYLREDTREIIAMRLLEELDQVTDFEKINVSMFVHNECIDEILFENEPLAR